MEKKPKYLMINYGITEFASHQHQSLVWIQQDKLQWNSSKMNTAGTGMAIKLWLFRFDHYVQCR